MKPLAPLPWGSVQNVSRVVRTRSRPASRLTQPWSIPTQMDESPKPTAAMLAGEPDVLRSLIRPFAGLASLQKYRNDLCCTVSSRAAVVWARTSAAPIASSVSARMILRM